MTTKLQLKRSAVPGRVPTNADLDLGEIGINTHDGKVFIKMNNGTESVIEVTSTSLAAQSKHYYDLLSFDMLKLQRQRLRAFHHFDF